MAHLMWLQRHFEALALLEGLQTCLDRPPMLRLLALILLGLHAIRLALFAPLIACPWSAGCIRSSYAMTSKQQACP